MKLVKNIMKTIVFSLAVPILIMMVIITLIEYNTTLNTYKSSMGMMAKRINMIAEQYLDNSCSNIGIDVNYPDIVEFVKNPADEMLRQQVVNRLKAVDEISDTAVKTIITNTKGEELTNIFPNANDYIDKQAFATAKNNNTSVISSCFSKLDGKPVFSVYVPISINCITVDAVIVQWISTDFIADMLKESSDENLYIIDNNSLILDYENEGKLLDIRNFDQPSGLAERIKNIMSWNVEKLHSIRYRKTDDTRMLAVFWRSAKHDITVVCEKNVSGVLANVITQVGISGAFLVLLIIMCVICYKGLKKQIEVPFNEVLTTMGEYENGNFSYRPVIAGEDEISSIAKSLWNMAKKISDIYNDVIENEYCYKKSMEFASDMLTDYTVSKNKFVADGEKWFNMFGFEFAQNEKQMNYEITARLHPDDARMFKEYRDKMFEETYDSVEKQMYLEFRMKLKDDQYHWIRRRDILVLGKNGNIEHILGSFENIDEQKKSEIELSSKAHYDQLTKLYNRATFMAKAKEWVKDHSSEECAMIFVDADNFKHVNDTYGHEAGDDVIRYIADTLKAAAGDKGICGRYGGDEFIMFIYNKEDAIDAAKYMIENLPKDFTVPSQENVILSMHSSVGVAFYPEHAYDMENLLKRADEAMYVSKKTGKDKYTIFDNSIKLI